MKLRVLAVAVVLAVPVFHAASCGAPDDYKGMIDKNLDPTTQPGLSIDQACALFAYSWNTESEWCVQIFGKPGPGP